MRSKLYQLPSGDWVIPENIISVIATQGDIENGITPCCIIGFEQRNYYDIKCSSYEEACSMRDQIAYNVNDLRIKNKYHTQE